MLEPWTDVNPSRDEVCPLCHRVVVADHEGNTKMKKRYVAAIAAAVAAVITVFTESVILGEMVGDVLRDLLA